MMNCFEFLRTVFVQGLLCLKIVCCQVFTIVHVVFIRSYGFGGEHYCIFMCEDVIEIACNDCNCVLIVVLNIVFSYYICL